MAHLTTKILFPLAALGLALGLAGCGGTDVTPKADKTSSGADRKVYPIQIPLKDATVGWTIGLAAPATSEPGAGDQFSRVLVTNTAAKTISYRLKVSSSDGKPAGLSKQVRVEAVALEGADACDAAAFKSATPLLKESSLSAPRTSEAVSLPQAGKSDLCLKLSFAPDLPTKLRGASSQVTVLFSPEK